jgi:hypothetical protein
MANKRWYRLTCKGYVVLTQRLYSKLETEKLFLTKDVMCERCFKENLRCNGLKGPSEENAEKCNGFCIDMVCKKVFFFLLFFAKDHIFLNYFFKITKILP